MSSGAPRDTLRHLSDSSSEETLMEARLAFRHSVASWCLRQAKRHMERGKNEAALEWNHIGAGVLRYGCAPLVSETLEQNLLEIASRLPRFEWRSAHDKDASRRWLHVIDYARPYGGHTAMVRRWIARDQGNRVHSVALPNQEHPVPEALADAIRDSGGEIFLPAPNASLLSRAIWLRELAYTKADCVVLHIYNEDVVAPTAFGVEGGPPVLLVNNAAHLFWTGAAVADVVINVRGSQLERFWTQHYRGISSTATLPIPIPLPQNADSAEVFSAECRAQARRRLNLPADAVVLLNVGRDEKYQSVSGLNFFEVARSLLASCPKAWMLVVGPSNSDYRKKLNQELNGRLAVLGVQLDLQPYYAAADVYVEGFPFGSTTALLEAGVHGLPCVLAPGDCPPPFGTDGVALDHELRRPANMEEYVMRVKELIAHPEERIRCGRSLARSICEHHCGTGWARYLADLIKQVPEVHTLHPVVQPPSPPKEFDHYWTRCFSHRLGDPFVYAFVSGISSGSTPRLDLSMYRARRAARRARLHGRGLQATVLELLSVLLPLFPAAVRRPLYRGITYPWRLRQWLRLYLSRNVISNPASIEAVVAQ